MDFRHCLRSAPALASAFIASHALGASFTIDDSVPGEITLIHDAGFDYSVVSNGTHFGQNEAGMTTSAGEIVTFTGDWQTFQSGTGGMGVIYLVDPGQTNLVRGYIEASWSLGTGHVFLTLTYTSAPLGGNLGIIPAAFEAFGVPISDSLIGLDGQFRMPGNQQKVFPPGSLNITFQADAFPECPQPVQIAQAPNQSGLLKSDLYAFPEQAFEMSERLTFGNNVLIFSMRWWGAYSGSADTPQEDADDFELRIYPDAGGAPASTPLSTHALPDAVRAGTGIDVFGLPEFIYAAPLPSPIFFSAGTTYWVTIVNNTTADPSDQWYWERSGTGDNLHAERTPPDTGTWTALGGDFAVEMCGFISVFECPPDFDGNGSVGGSDLAFLLAAWGASGGQADLSGDGNVDGEDLAALLAGWGSCSGG